MSILVKLLQVQRTENGLPENRILDFLNSFLVPEDVQLNDSLILTEELTKLFEEVKMHHSKELVNKIMYSMTSRFLSPVPLDHKTSADNILMATIRCTLSASLPDDRRKMHFDRELLGLSNSIARITRVDPETENILSSQQPLVAVRSLKGLLAAQHLNK